MAYIVIDLFDRSVVGAYQTRSDAEVKARTLPNLAFSDVDVTLPADFNLSDVLWFLNTSNEIVPEVDPDDSFLLLEYKRVGAIAVRKLEETPGLAAWATASPERAKSFSRWAEMMVRALAVDENITDVVKRTKIAAEYSIPGRTWYWLHNLAVWQVYLPDDRSRWVWYNTSGTTVTSDSRVGAQDATITLNRSVTFDPTRWLDIN